MSISETALAALDRLSEDDTEAVQPETVTVRVLDDGLVLRVPGLPLAVARPDCGSLEPLRRYLQRHLDGLRNSEAAALLIENRREEKHTTTFTVKVPLAVARVAFAEPAP